MPTRLTSMAMAFQAALHIRWTQPTKVGMHPLRRKTQKHLNEIQRREGGRATEDERLERTVIPTSPAPLIEAAPDDEKVAAAQGMRASAPAAGTAPAFAATLGCLEATLDALAAATRAMGEEAVEQAERIEEAPAEPGAFTSRQALRRFEDLVDTLQAAQATAGALRERVGAITVAQRAD